MSSQASVIVLGGCVTDLITYVDRFPLPGETIVARNFCKGFGGKGANTAYMCARLGAPVALLAKLGDDSFGRDYRDYLVTAGIDAQHITVEPSCPSPTAGITVVNANGENTIAYFPGSVDRLTCDDVLRARDSFAKARVFAAVFETPLKSLVCALQQARANHLVTYVNAAPAPSTESLPVDCFPLIDFLCVNETEASALVAILRRQNQQQPSSCNLNDDFLHAAPLPSLSKVQRQSRDESLVRALLATGAGTVIMTLGERGALYATCANASGTTAGSQAPRLPAAVDGSVLICYEATTLPTADYKMPVVDTTGAGDAFNGAFLYQLAENVHRLSTGEMVRRACAIATMTVYKRGTQSSYPHRGDVPSFFFQ